MPDKSTIPNDKESEEETAVIKNVAQISSKKYKPITSLDDDEFRRGYLTQNYHYSTRNGHVREMEI